MDPTLFCSEYFSIYKATYNCPDMSHDDSSFLCSMANKCTCIDYHTRIALRNATSYQTFINTLRDWVRETDQDNRPHKRISEIAKSEGRVRFAGRCYRCGKAGPLMKDCKLPRRSTGEKKPWHKKEQQKPGPDKVAKEPSEAVDATTASFEGVTEDRKNTNVMLVVELGCSVNLTIARGAWCNLGGVSEIQTQEWNYVVLHIANLSVDVNQNCPVNLRALNL
ncbi:hypothetical protein AB205_0012520, partial [Aquarana catesbeiana]